MKKTTLALSIVTALVLWGCGGSSSNDNQPLDKKNEQHQLNKKNDDKTGGDKTGGDKTGGDKTGGDKTGGDKTGGDKTGGDNAGDDKTGDDKTGGDDKDKCTVDPNAPNCKKDDDDNKDKNKITAESVKAEKTQVEADIIKNTEELQAAQKKLDGLEKAKEAIKLPELQQAVDSAQKEVNEHPDDLTKKKDLATAQANLTSAQDTITAFNKAQEDVNEKTLEKVKLESKKAEIGVKEEIVKAQDAKQPKSNTDLLNEKLKEKELEGKVNLAKEKLKIAEKVVGDASGGLTKEVADAQTAVTAAESEWSNEKDATAKEAKKKEYEQKNQALENKQQELAEAEKNKADAQKDVDDFTAEKEAATEKVNAAKAIDANRALAGDGTGLALDSFQGVSKVEKKGNVWTITFNNDEKPLVIDTDKNANKVLSTSLWKKDTSYYGQLRDAAAIRTYPDSVFGYSNGKFYSVGTVTPEDKMKGMSGEAYYKGTAFLKSDDNKDLLSDVLAKANFGDKVLSGSFSNFYSYNPADVAKNNAFDAKKENGLTDVAFSAKIDGNRFINQPTAEGEGEKAKVYGYFYGVEGGGTHKNADEIGGLVEYSKFHGSFGAKHHNPDNGSECYGADGTTDAQNCK